MKKWIKRIALGLVLMAVSCAVWITAVFVIPAHRYYKAHRKIYDSTSLAKLQELAPTLLSMNASDRTLTRGNMQMPPALRDLDPSWVSIAPDAITIELHGGHDHFGFLYRKIADDPRKYEIYRYSEFTEEELLGEYTESDPAMHKKTGP